MKNSITDVPGIQVGHFTLAAGDTQTGVTAILPYPLSVRNRKLFIGGFASGNWNEWTGLQVAQDFGTFSSPIVLCNSTAVGIAYDALISFGHERDEGLPIDNAWPPLVIGLDDGYLNDLRQRRLTHDQVLQVIKQANANAVACGSVGIGRGLCALGAKGGCRGCFSRHQNRCKRIYTWCVDRCQWGHDKNSKKFTAGDFADAKFGGGGGHGFSSPA